MMIPISAYLNVRIAASMEANRLNAYDVELSFVQIVFLRRKPSVTFNRAQTWKALGRIGIAAPAQVSEAIQQELARQLDQFIKAYLAVNPADTGLPAGPR